MVRSCVGGGCVAFATGDRHEGHSLGPLQGFYVTEPGAGKASGGCHIQLHPGPVAKDGGQR